MLVTSLRFVLVSVIVSLVILTSIFDTVFADESEDITKQLAEKHKILAQTYEKEARELANAGNLQDAADKFALSAEQYSESASYYRTLNDYFNAAEYNGRAALAHEESDIIHSELYDYPSSLLHYLLSDKFNAHSLQDKGVILFGDAYLLPPKSSIT